MNREALKEFDAMLRLYEQNFRNLHWNSIGLEFNDSHKNITTEYYEMLSETVDEVAEILCMVDEDPANYMEAINILNGSSKKYLIVDSNKKYTKADIVNESQTMLVDICNSLAVIASSIEEPEYAGIKSGLEDMLYKYSKEKMYLNKRRTEQ
jgi:DNA-binding ferritin-like protein